MSDEIAEVTETEPVIDSGSTEVGGYEAEDTPTLSIDEYANYRVPVKLDGEELQVPLSEAIAGYQRQADYTRKTQELSEQRQQMQFASAIQAALENDPATTIDLLASHYGISRSAAANMADSFDLGEEEFQDPSEKRLRELDQRIARFEELESQQQVEREISRLQSKYEDFDINEVVTTAIRMGTTDLEGTYKQMAFDKLMQQMETMKMAEQQKVAEQEKILQAKREASVVDGGTSATASTTSESFEPITSIHDAWLAAKRQFNVDI